MGLHTAPHMSSPSPPLLPKWCLVGSSGPGEHSVAVGSFLLGVQQAGMIKCASFTSLLVLKVEVLLRLSPVSLQ